MTTKQIYDKARELGMFDDLCCPQESCGATMRIPHEKVDFIGDEVFYDCPSCGVGDCISREIMEEYIEDMNE